MEKKAIVSARVLISSCRDCPHCFRRTLAVDYDYYGYNFDDGEEKELVGYFCEQVTYDQGRDSSFYNKIDSIIRYEKLHRYGDYDNKYRPIAHDTINPSMEDKNIIGIVEREDWVSGVSVFQIPDWCPCLAESDPHGGSFDFKFSSRVT
ncbi:hypothetical protein IKF34_01510 [Candidatus Saccharibacteria bacterium]|nr:hypothetical protein [Candidatus Saccharibacteria bacterium]